MTDSSYLYYLFWPSIASECQGTFLVLHIVVQLPSNSLPSFQGLQEKPISFFVSCKSCKYWFCYLYRMQRVRIFLCFSLASALFCLPVQRTFRSSCSWCLNVLVKAITAFRSRTKCITCTLWSKIHPNKCSHHFVLNSDLMVKRRH